MKKIIGLILSIVLLVSFAGAEGLLPRMEDAFGTGMPSIYGSSKKAPSEKNTLEDGSVEEVWYQFSDDDYQAFGNYLMQSGCELQNYTVEGSLFQAEIKKGDKIYLFNYDSSQLIAKLVFPKGTYDLDITEAEKKYQLAVEYLEAGKLEEAKDMFLQIGLSYNDSCAQINKITRQYRKMISNGHAVIAIKDDGTWMMTDGYTDDWDFWLWRNMSAMYDALDGVVGIKKDGSVVASFHGNNDRIKREKKELTSWGNMDYLSPSPFLTLGLTKSGTVYAVGDDDAAKACLIGNTSSIVAISAGNKHSVGVKKTGEVVAYGDNEKGQCNVSEWRDIVDVAAGRNHTVGLKSDGTVVAVGDNEFGQCDVEDWKDIIAIAAGSEHTIGLKTDGTVVAVGQGWNSEIRDYDDMYDLVKDWKDIIAIDSICSETSVTALKTDGKIVDSRKYRDEDIGKWKLW